MNRRTFLLSSLAAAAPARANGQNVLFISIDDLNDWVGCLGGHPNAKTPNLDRLAGRGVLFTKAYCAAPVCNPSRAALITGVRPSTSGVYENQQPMRLAPALRDAVTLPQHFTAAGYHASGAGKIYHGAFPDPPSWSEYFPSQQRNMPQDARPPRHPMNGMPRTAQFDWGPLDVPEAEMGDSKVAEWVIRQLERKQDRPFFLGCGFYKPHLPWYVPRKYFEMHPADKLSLPEVKDDDLDDVPETGRWLALRSGDHKKVLAHDQWRKAVQGYLASISFADAMLGRVIDALDAGPHAKNTSIVLWSDHGWHLGEKLHWRKFALWEEATRNVLLVVAPGVTKPGGRCGRTVSLLDVYPTLTDLCGLPAGRGQEGVSLVPLLRKPDARWDRPALTTYLRGNHSVRSERWRYIRYQNGGEELYDHSVDPLEWRNVAGRAEFAGVKRELSRWLPRVDAADSPSARELPPGPAD